MEALLDMTHYYVEIGCEASINNLNGTRIKTSYTLLDVTNIEDILEPINLSKEHRCIIKVRVSDRENYRRMCELVSEDKLYSRLVETEDIDIMLKYNNIYTCYLHKVDNFLFLTLDGDRGLGQVFNIYINIAENNKLKDLNKKLNMLGIGNQNIVTFGNNATVMIRNQKDDAAYINKIIAEFSFVRLSYMCSLRNNNIDIYNNKISEINITTLFQKFHNIKLPFNKVLILSGTGNLMSETDIEFNCNTWIVGRDTRLRMTISANNYINSRYIKYLRNIRLHPMLGTDYALDLRGLENNIILDSVCIGGFSTILINACDESNMSSISPIELVDIKKIISNNINISETITNQGIQELVYMNSDIQSDISDFENLSLSNKFSRIATAEERKLYQKEYL